MIIFYIPKHLWMGLYINILAELWCWAVISELCFVIKTCVNTWPYGHFMCITSYVYHLWILWLLECSGRWQYTPVSYNIYCEFNNTDYFYNTYYIPVNWWQHYWHQRLIYVFLKLKLSHLVCLNFLFPSQGSTNFWNKVNAGHDMKVSGHPVHQSTGFHKHFWKRQISWHATCQHESLHFAFVYIHKTDLR